MAQQPPPQGQYNPPPQQSGPYYQPPPPPGYYQQPPVVVVQQKSGGGCFKWIGIAVVAVVVIGVIAAVAAPKGNTGPGTTKNPSAHAATAKIGEKVTVGSWEVTVEKVESSTGFDWTGFKNMQNPKGIYVMVFVNATNTSNKTASVNSFDYKVFDSTGAEFAACIELGCIAYPKEVDRESFLTEVPPRLSTKLLAIFDVAPGTKGMVLAIERDTKIALGDIK